MALTSKKKARAGGGGLTAKSYTGGLSKKRVEAAAGSGNKIFFNKEDPTIVVQFMGPISDASLFKEFDQHAFQEEGTWAFVPCAGDDCPLDASESEQVRKTGYRMCCNVYDHKTKRVRVLEGPRNLSAAVISKFERLKNKSLFTKRVYEITKLPTKPANTYNIDLAEDESAVDVGDLKPLDLDAFLVDELKRYYGDDTTYSPSALDDEDEDEEELEEEEDDEDEDADEEEDEDEEPEDFDDEADEDEDEDEEDDEDEDEDEDEEPEPPRRASAAKKAPAKKAAAPVAKATAKKAAPAKKAAARR